MSTVQVYVDSNEKVHLQVLQEHAGGDCLSEYPELRQRSHSVDDSSLIKYKKICSEEFQARRLFFNIRRRTDFWRPQCGGDNSPQWFLIVRGLMAAYTLAVWIYDVSTLSIGNFSSYPDFAYMTFWTFTLVGAYFVYATIAAVYEFFRDHYGPNNRNSPILFGSTTKHLVVLFLLSAISRACAMCVFVGFYGYVILFDKTDPVFHNFTSVNEHAVVLVLILIDVYASRIPVFLLHSIYPTLFGILYLTFHVIYHFAGGENGMELIYQQLDWRHNFVSTIGWVAAFIFTFPFFHFVTWLVYKSKQVCAEKLQCGASTEPELEEEYEEYSAAAI